jgi:hypothetical protein|tara:strand:- start:606 stop:896 length:291 start_codon:yes stop_codon:yes gene_type:complete
MNKYEQTLTENELEVLKAIDNSEYGDFLTDDIYAWSIADNIQNVTIGSVAGIVSSLNKKGLIVSRGTGDDAGVRITNEGVKVYVDKVGEVNVRKTT